MSPAANPFPGKILLFGEYSLMLGSAALVLPFSRHYVKLLFPDISLSASEARIAENSNRQLKSFLEFLQERNSGISTHFAFEQMQEDLANGLYLWSNIPSGYGLGSSGALVAAIFNKYGASHSPDIAGGNTGDEIIPPEKLADLKTTFARMESFFHGSSSGVDPLSSYVNKPLLVDDQQSISVVTRKLASSSNGGFFLLDTRKQRNTKPLVKAFQAKCQHTGFREMLNKEYIPLNNACVNAVIKNDCTLQELMHRLSDLQLKYFKELIPEEFLLSWAQGLSSGKYTLKLCGAGGGGFLLGYTDDYLNVSQGKSKLEQNIITLNDYL